MKKYILLSLAVLLACYVAFHDVLGLPDVTGLLNKQEKQEIKMNIECIENPWHFKDGLAEAPLENAKDFSHIEFNWEGSRIYQFLDGSMGRIVRYTITSTDPTKPLASLIEVERQPNGFANKVIKQSLHLKVSPNSNDWKYVFSQGMYTKTFNLKGIAIREDFCDECTIVVHDWSKDSLANYDHVSLELYPGPLDPTGKGMDPPPIHSVEIDFYLHP